MAVDFEAIRRKLNQLSGQGNKRNVMWRPQEGEEVTVRLLSFPDNEDGLPFAERWFYYNIGNNPGLLAPYQFGNPDPIQDLINKLRDEGTKESYELAKKLYPKPRYYAPVVVRGEEEKGVRVWSFGKTVYQSLLNIMLDEDYGDITDVMEGRDVKVICTKAPGRMWATTEVRPRGKTTRLSSDAAQVKNWTSNIPDVGDLYAAKSEGELEKIINDWLAGDLEESNQSEGTTRNTKLSDESTSTSEPTQKKFASLDDAFADLENDF